MWSVRTDVSSDPDQFVSAIRPSGSKILVTERGNFHGETTLIDFDRLYALRGEEHLARVLHITPPRTGIIFRTRPGPEMLLNGAEVRYDQVVLHASGETHLMRLTGPTAYGAMTLADDQFDAICAPSLGLLSEQISGFSVITPPADVLARLRSSHAAAANSAEAAVGLPNHIGRAEALEQALIGILAEIIEVAHPGPDSLARQHHHLIIRRFLDMLEPHLVWPRDMQKVSNAIGVSSRTLRVVCQEQLGVSPTQYLLLRRMGMARRALQQADPGTTRVTDIATVLGFWELGRFAVRYREIFGEPPSATLKAVGSSSRGFALADYGFA
jgi:AraC-like DNA-binding protein